jgi:hypothetical protein
MSGLKVRQARLDLLAFVWRRAIDRIREMRHDEHYDRWTLSEREMTVKVRNRENRERKARERSAARKALRAEEKRRALANRE